MPKKVVGFMNSCKNKLNSEIILIFNLNPKRTLRTEIAFPSEEEHE